MPTPVYPEGARKKGIEGTVEVRALVTKEGTVRKAHIGRSADPDLDASALNAVKRAVFQPAREKGRVVAAWVAIPVRFVLDSHGSEKGGGK
jgi:protein TonB